MQNTPKRTEEELKAVAAEKLKEFFLQRLRELSDKQRDQIFQILMRDK
jgi:hypothetical protein